MKLKINTISTFFIIVFASFAANAQQGEVIIDQDKDIEKLLEFKKDIKKKIKSIGTEQALDKIKRQKSAYENYFIQIEQKQKDDLIRKHTQTYDLKDFIISSIESIIYALENIDTDGNDGEF